LGVTFWQKGLIALALLWALQAIGTWVQMRHYRVVMREIAQNWPDGLMGASAVRGYLGKGVIAIVVATRDETVRQVFVMEGRSVFAKFRELREMAGMTLTALAATEGAPRARHKAIAGAIVQIRRTASSAATDVAEASGALAA
jgi:glucitol operon activator protein